MRTRSMWGMAGIDNDVKIWAPTAEAEVPITSEVQEVMRMNRDRDLPRSLNQVGELLRFPAPKHGLPSTRLMQQVVSHPHQSRPRPPLQLQSGGARLFHELIMHGDPFIG